MSGPCAGSWTVERCSCSATCWSARSPAIRDRAATLAAHWMWAATGRRYGLCEITVQPCNPAPPDPLYQTYGLAPDPGVGLVFGAGTVSSGGCAGDCTCAGRCEVSLPRPVDSILEVSVNCEALAPDAYRVYDGHLLTRIDGGCWPTCATYGEIPGFEVTYDRGVPVPAAVQVALEGLACQVAKSCEGASDCALPPRVRSITRQGVSIEVATEEAETLGGGKMRTGIKWIDDIIAANNPDGLVEAPQVLSLDAPPPRVVTYQGGS
jgi:hypothetical protein